MSEFITWLGATIAQFWTFLVNTNVPGCPFSFAAFLLFFLVLDFGIFILKIVFSGNTQGGTKDFKKLDK